MRRVMTSWLPLRPSMKLGRVHLLVNLERGSRVRFPDVSRRRVGLTRRMSILLIIILQTYLSRPVKPSSLDRSSSLKNLDELLEETSNGRLPFAIMTTQAMMWQSNWEICRKLFIKRKNLSVMRFELATMKDEVKSPKVNFAKL